MHCLLCSDRDQRPASASNSIGPPQTSSEEGRVVAHNRSVSYILQLTFERAPTLDDRKVMAIGSAAGIAVGVVIVGLIFRAWFLQRRRRLHRRQSLHTPHPYPSGSYMHSRLLKSGPDRLLKREASTAEVLPIIQSTAGDDGLTIRSGSIVTPRPPSRMPSRVKARPHRAQKMLESPPQPSVPVASPSGGERHTHYARPLHPLPALPGPSPSDSQSHNTRGSAAPPPAYTS